MEDVRSKMVEHKKQQQKKQLEEDEQAAGAKDVAKVQLLEERIRVKDEGHVHLCLELERLGGVHRSEMLEVHRLKEFIKELKGDFMSVRLDTASENDFSAPSDCVPPSSRGAPAEGALEMVEKEAAARLALQTVTHARALVQFETDLAEEKEKAADLSRELADERARSAKIELERTQIPDRQPCLHCPILQEQATAAQATVNRLFQELNQVRDELRAARGIVEEQQRKLMRSPLQMHHGELVSTQPAAVAQPNAGSNHHRVHELNEQLLEERKLRTEASRLAQKLQLQNATLEQRNVKLDRDLKALAASQQELQNAKIEHEQQYERMTAQQAALRNEVCALEGAVNSWQLLQRQAPSQASGGGPPLPEVIHSAMQRVQTVLAQELAAKARYKQMWSQQQNTLQSANPNVMDSLAQISQKSDASYTRMLAQLQSPSTEVHALCNYKV